MTTTATIISNLLAEVAQLRVEPYFAKEAAAVITSVKGGAA